MKHSRCYAVIVAGGKGLRMGLALKKQYARVGGIPILSRTLTAFDQIGLITGIILVVPPDDAQFCKETIIEAWPVNLPVEVACGGTDRQSSVFSGLRAVKKKRIDPQKDIVLIHDGVRPFVSRDLIKACMDKASECGAAVPCCEIVETVKRVNQENNVTQTVSRSDLYTAQTPQAFRFGVIWQAHVAAQKENINGTDDAALVEYSGEKVSVVPGLRTNIKITRPEDLFFAEYLSAQRPASR